MTVDVIGADKISKDEAFASLAKFVIAANVEDGCKSIIKERISQLSKHHFTIESDYQSSPQRLILGAIGYAVVAASAIGFDIHEHREKYGDTGIFRNPISQISTAGYSKPIDIPDDLDFNPINVRRDLIKAGALIAAALDVIAYTDGLVSSVYADIAVSDDD